nr:MAG TPA: hypothetical protein [Caudoviricetes sp.]
MLLANVTHCQKKTEELDNVEKSRSSSVTRCHRRIQVIQKQDKPTEG